MTGSGSDFKARQQQELDRFNELWNAAAADSAHLPKLKFTSSSPKIRSLLELAQNIFGIHCAGAICYDLQQEFTLIGTDFKTAELDISEKAINMQIRELLQGPTVDVKAELPTEYIETFDHIPFEIQSFVRFPLMEAKRVKGFFYLLNPSAKVFSSEEVRSIELLSQTLSESLSGDSSLVSEDEFSRIKNEMARLKAIIEGASGDIFVVNTRDCSIILANSHGREKLEYSDEELQKLAFTEICSIGEVAFRSHVRALVQGQLSEFTCETQISKKSGETFPAIVELTCDTHGDEPVLVVYVRDLTNRLRRQAEFESLSAYHKAALTVASDVSIGMEAIFDQSGKIIDFYIQQAQLGDFGSREKEDVVGRRFLDAMPTAKTNGFFNRCVEAFYSNELDVFEQEYVTSEMNEYFRVSAIRVGDDFLQLGLRVITEKKHRNTVWLALHELSNSLDISTHDYMERMLHIGRKALGMEFGQISDVIPGEASVRVTHVAGKQDVSFVGEVIPLKDTLFVKYGVENKPIFLSKLNIPCRNVDADGKHRYIRAYTAAPIFINGEIGAFVSFITDKERLSKFDEFEMGIVSIIAKFISQRKSLDFARQELEASRDELQLIFDNVPAKIYRRDQNNRYIKVNKAGADQFGFSPETFVGMHPNEVVADYDNRFSKIDEAVLNSGKPCMGKEFDCNEDGSAWERVDVVPVIDAQGCADGLLLICTDITVQKNAEIQLETVVRELEAANQNLEQFNTVVSHDLKAPLRHMRMLAELLLEAVEPTSSAVEYAKLIQENAVNGQAMIDALMALSRVSRKDLNRSSIDLDEVVKSVTEIVHSELSDANGTIVCEALPRVMADTKLITNLFQNLIENAIKYRSDAPLKIEIGVDSTGNTPVFFVRDNGRGIGENYSKTIFQIFVRVGGANAKEKGEGVGLSICRRIVERHGGKIWLDTDYKDGACFKFTLG